MKESYKNIYLLLCFFFDSVLVIFFNIYLLIDFYIFNFKFIIFRSKQVDE